MILEVGMMAHMPTHPILESLMLLAFIILPVWLTQPMVMLLLQQLSGHIRLPHDKEEVY
jgi:hypothetical protein